MISLVEDKKEWSALLNECVHYDFYHTYEYHQLSVEEDDFKLVKFFQDDVLILFPIVIRKIPGTGFFDVTSAYGYVGPTSNREATDIPASCIKLFNTSLQRFFEESRIIAAFSRLHTLFDQRMFFSDLGTIKDLNQTVYVDLSLAPDVQRAQYGKSTKNQTNKLRNQGFTVRKATSEKDLDEFLRIYYTTMDRLKAHKHYYFSKEYFQCLLDATEFNAFILLAEKDGQTTAASMFTACNQFMQYHLSGTGDDFLKFTPMKLLLDEARLIGNDLGLKKFNLGGGYSGGNDSLFEFKASFSKNIELFRVWSHIVNPQVYNELLQAKFGNHVPDVNFFPLYRYTN